MATTDYEPTRPMRVGDRPALSASLVTAGDGRLQCTLHPPQPADDEVTTRWLTALEDSFVDARSMR
jgi:hypothetical protein